ncbi:MAG: 50S ribosomal protein L24 [Acholeplasmatales bacterium]|jgi:large subunit ribosomal protein L24|nr:50S ribosomal protein L24 [Acholeplasmatales bacterium]
MKIKTGDTVVLLTGDQDDKFVVDKKGKKTRKTGKVVKVFPDKNQVLVEGMNKVKKHQRPTQQNEKGQIIEAEAPINVSNVAIIDPKTNVPTKIGYKIVNGKKLRFAKESGELLDKLGK